MPVVPCEKVSPMGFEPGLTAKGHVNGSEVLGVVDVMVNPLALVTPVHAEVPFNETSFRELPEVAQKIVMDLM